MLENKNQSRLENTTPSYNRIVSWNIARNLVDLQLLLIDSPNNNTESPREKTKPSFRCKFLLSHTVIFFKSSPLYRNLATLK